MPISKAKSLTLRAGALIDRAGATATGRIAASRVARIARRNGGIGTAVRDPDTTNGETVIQDGIAARNAVRDPRSRWNRSRSRSDSCRINAPSKA